MAGAVFSDVEGTLLGGNTPILFVKVGRHIGIFSRWELVRTALLGLLAKPLPNRANAYMRFLAFRLLMKGHTSAEMDTIIEESFPEVVKNLKPVTLARLRQHQEEGYPVVLVSGGLQEMVGRLGRELRMRGEGTRLEVQDGVYTGRGLGKACQGREKAARMQAVAREMGVDLAASIGYGDTRPDIAFLELVGKAGVVDPAPALRAKAEKHGWEIMLSENEPKLTEAITR